MCRYPRTLYPRTLRQSGACIILPHRGDWCHPVEPNETPFDSGTSGCPEQAQKLDGMRGLIYIRAVRRPNNRPMDRMFRDRPPRHRTQVTGDTVGILADDQSSAQCFLRIPIPGIEYWSLDVVARRRPRP